MIANLIKEQKPPIVAIFALNTVSIYSPQKDTLYQLKDNLLYYYK